MNAIWPLRNRLAFALRGAGWGVLPEDGKAPVLHAPGIVGHTELRVDATGSRVRFSYGAGVHAEFSVGEHLLRVGASLDSRILPASASAAGGAQRPASIPASALATAVSGDGRLVVAALPDGTLRWYTMADGKELLAFLPHADRKRWIAWTPGGYYATSVNGESLLGWHVNRKVEQAADFFRASLFRDDYYRPDVTARVLFTQDEARALAEADAEAGRRRRALPLRRLLPPVVTILDPAEGSAAKSSQVQIRVAVRSPSGEPVSRVWHVIRGHALQARDFAALTPGRGTASDPEEAIHVINVTIPPEDCTVMVMAETTHATGEPAVLNLRWEGPRGKGVAATRDLRVLAVGVSEYRDRRLQLDYPAKDAADLARTLRGQEGKLYRSVEVRVLANKDATQARLLEGLDWLHRRTTQGDVSVVFLAGHGINDAETGDFHFVPYDGDPAAGRATMLSSMELRRELARVSGTVLLFLDTCHSGNVMGAQPLRNATDLTRLTNSLSSVQSGIVVYTASTSGQVSRESPRWGNGAFTKALVEGLRGKADVLQTGRITTSTLETYVSQRVQELTGGEQTPTTAKPTTVPDFEVALVRVRYPIAKKWWFWTGVGLVAAGIVLSAEPWVKRPQVFDF